MNENRVPERNAFGVMNRVQSFGYALQGLGFMLRTQHNAWLHAAATIGVISLAWFLGVRLEDWRWLVVAVVTVWVAETFNTAVEYVCDVVSPGYSEAVRRAKDIAASAVLIAAMGALLVGLITLWPYLSSMATQ